MANLYMGRGGIDGLFGATANPQFNDDRPVGNTPLIPTGPFKPFPKGQPGQFGGGSTTLPNPVLSKTVPGNILQAGAVRASGPSQGYDPSYLQNLATSIGSLFARPQGNLSFNPLGNLSDISPPSGQMGNAPGFGEPETWLQQALNGLSFLFKPPAPPSNPFEPRNDGRGGGEGRGRGGRFELQ